MIEPLLWTYLTGNIELVESSFIIYAMTMNKNVHYFRSHCFLIDIMPLNICECIVQAKNNIGSLCFQIRINGGLDPGIDRLEIFWDFQFFFGTFRGLRWDLRSNLAKALPNRRLFILACSETWIWMNIITQIEMKLLIQFIVNDETIDYTCFKISAWFMKVLWCNIGQ